MDIFKEKDFISSFLLFFVFFTLCFYFLIQIHKKNQNPMIENENNFMFFILIFLIGFFFKSFITYQSSIQHQSYASKFCLWIFVLFILQYGILYLIENYYKPSNQEKDDISSIFNLDQIKKYSFVILSSIGLCTLFMIIYPYQNKDFYQTFIQVFQEEKIYYLLFFLLYFLYRFLFGLFYTKSAKTSLFLPGLLGVFMIISIFLFVIYMGTKFKIINWKNHFTTFLVLMMLFSFFIYVWLYMFMDNLNSICKNKKINETTKTKNFLSKYISPLLIISIFIMLWLVDSKKWSRIESIFYILITILLFSSFSFISTNYPDSSLLSLWLMIEWFITTYYNWLNVSNSFHTIFSTP